MKRDFLEKLGLEKEVIDQIMAENGKDIEAKKKELDEVSEAKKTAEAMLAERDKQIETLSKSKGNAEELQAEIEKLKTANKEDAEKHQSELKEIKMNNAIQAALGEAKARNLKSVETHLDKSKLQMQEDGTLVGLAEQIKTLTEGEETKFLFGEPETKVIGVKTVTPGASSATTDQDMDAWRQEAGLK